MSHSEDDKTTGRAGAMNKGGRRPNLLFLITDQQRADTVAPDSPCHTPHVDSLAGDGVRFERCYSQNPVCSPSRASLMTGLLPHSHGMVDITHAVETYRADLKPDLPFWSRTLQQAGYRTGYFGKWHVERSDELERFGFDEYELIEQGGAGSQGFHEYRERLGLGAQAGLAERYDLRHKGYHDFLLYGVTDEPVEATAEHYLYSRGIEFLDRHEDESQPWALFISSEGPHDPFVVPREYRERYDVKDIPRPASWGDDLADRPGLYRRLQGVYRGLDWSEFAEATACYYAFCSLVDDQVGRILSRLRTGGDSENTLITYTSDHGDYMGAHRLLQKGMAPFEEAYKVPLILKGPGVPVGETRSQIVSLIDVAPTLVELTLNERFACQGRSLVPLLEAAAAQWSNEAFAEFHGQRFSYSQRTLWRDRYKYVFNCFDEDELYDLAADPHELRNLAAEPELKPVLEKLAARMWEIIVDTDDFNMYEAEYGIFRFAPVGPAAAKARRREDGSGRR